MRVVTLAARVLFSTSLIALVLLASAVQSRAQSCTPGSCVSTFHHVDFESFLPGTSVEGPGAVDAGLTITSVAWPFAPSCVVGSAMVVEEGNTSPYDAWSTNSSVENGCLNGIRGFTDNEQCVLDYDFTFAPDVTVSCFALRIVDWGDYFPFGGSTHTVSLTAYDAGDNVVDQTLLSTSGGTDLIGGDACTSQAGDPGNFILSVAGPGIVKVSLRHNEFTDPNVGYDDIVFCEVSSVTPARQQSWGFLKMIYR